MTSALRHLCSVALLLLSCVVCFPSSALASSWLQTLAANPAPHTPAAFASGLLGWFESDFGVSNPDGLHSLQVGTWLNKVTVQPFTLDGSQTFSQAPWYFTQPYIGSAGSDDLQSIIIRKTQGGYLGASLTYSITDTITLIVALRISTNADNGGVVFAANANDVGQLMQCKWFSDGHLEFVGPAGFTTAAATAPAGAFLILTIRCGAASVLRINRAELVSAGAATATGPIPAPLRFGAGGDDEAVLGPYQELVLYGLAVWSTALDDARLEAVERYFLRHFQNCTHL